MLHLQQEIVPVETRFMGDSQNTKKKLPTPNNVCCRNWLANTTWFSSPKRPDGTRFMESEHLQKSDVSCGHEPGRRLQSGTGFQPVSPEQARCLCDFLRFMEREQLLPL
ncbi:MAG: hypothetical protein DME19_19695 [Verrucomicrobia bacterium]|nr:MAG: hypothetical protein DME19_19695 [Verrucomicrobiota bacterium]